MFRFAVTLGVLVAALGGGSARAIDPLPAGQDSIRVAYLIPSNRTALPEGVAILQEVVRTMSYWTCVHDSVWKDRVWTPVQ